MVKCSFSGKEIPAGKGIMYVKSDGKVLYFYDKKAEKNMLKLGRKPQKIKWTEEGRKAKRERMTALEHQKKESKQKK
jgi:ribosomal protein L24E